MLTFVKEITPKGFRIPHAAMELGGFESGRQAEYHVRDHLVVVLKRQMTAIELLAAAQGLERLAVKLYAQLADACGPCLGCEGGCPCADADSTVEIPGWLRQEAGIPEDAKLCAEVDAEKGLVTVSEADYRHDLRDLQKDILEMFSDAGTCLEELERHLMMEDIVYGD